MAKPGGRGKKKTWVFVSVAFSWREGRAEINRSYKPDL